MPDAVGCQSYEALDSSAQGNPGTYAAAFGFGTLIGLLLVKSAAHLPSVISGQLSGDSFLLARFYMAAVTSSLLTGGILHLWGDTVKQRCAAARMVRHNGVLAILVGGLCIGAGMVIGQSVPLLIPAQIGAQTTAGYSLLLGGLLAVLVYGFADSANWCTFRHQCMLDTNQMDNFFNTRYSHVALPLGLVFMVLCYIMECRIATRWAVDVPYDLKTIDRLQFSSISSWTSAMLTTIWSPYVVGAAFGSIQLLFRLMSSYPADATHAYISAVALPLTWISEKLNCSSPRWFVDHAHSSHLWSVFLCLGIGTGSFLSLRLFDASERYILCNQSGPSGYSALLGGFLLVFGSLIAGGCPSGLGISATGDLNITAWLATGALMASAVLFSAASTAGDSPLSHLGTLESLRGKRIVWG